jgi:hypothetical protein
MRPSGEPDAGRKLIKVPSDFLSRMEFLQSGRLATTIAEKQK